jgi:hypothetical protein
MSEQNVESRATAGARISLLPDQEYSFRSNLLSRRCTLRLKDDALEVVDDGRAALRFAYGQITGLQEYFAASAEDPAHGRFVVMCLKARVRGGTPVVRPRESHDDGCMACHRRHQ